MFDDGLPFWIRRREKQLGGKSSDSPIPSWQVFGWAAGFRFFSFHQFFLSHLLYFAHKYHEMCGNGILSSLSDTAPTISYVHILCSMLRLFFLFSWRCSISPRAVGSPRNITANGECIWLFCQINSN